MSRRRAMSMRQGYFAAASSLTKEVAQHLSALFLQYPAAARDAVVKAVVGGEQVEEAAGGSSFGVGCAKDEAGDAGVDQRSGAHYAGFEGDVEGGAGEAVVAEALPGITQGEDFGVGAGVVATNRAVVAASDGDPVANEQCANRHLTGQLRLDGEEQCFAHPVAVIGVMAQKSRSCLIRS